MRTNSSDAIDIDICHIQQKLVREFHLNNQAGVQNREMGRARKSLHGWASCSHSRAFDAVRINKSYLFQKEFTF